jgi:hypothetical protein
VLPKLRQAGEDSKEKWNNTKVLRKDAHDLKLSVVAPAKEKKGTDAAKAETSTPKTKSRGSKVPVEQVFFIKSEPRQDNRRREREQKDRADHPHPHPKKQTPAAAAATTATPAAASTTAKIDKNSKDFPALVAVKN